jgi:hypothetical protein
MAEGPAVAAASANRAILRKCFKEKLVKSKLAAMVRKTFTERLAQKLPQFRPVPVPADAVVVPGARIYEWHYEDAFWCYILLHIGTDRDGFTIDIAWTRTRGYPREFLNLLPRDYPALGLFKERPRKGDFEFRLSLLWEPKYDEWWQVTPDNIEAMVDDAIEKIVSYAIPYLKETAETLAQQSPEEEWKMGAPWFVCLERNIPDVDHASLDGEFVAQEFDELDRVAARLHVRPISDFLCGTPEQIDNALKEWRRKHTGQPPEIKEHWFDASEGLRTITALLEHLRLEAAEFYEETNPTIEDLEAIQRILERAAECKVRFHFSAEVD